LANEASTHQGRSQASATHDQTVQSILEGGYPALTGLAAAEPAWATLWSRRVGGLRPRTPVSASCPPCRRAA